MYEKQICPRCEISFECKPGNIGQCECYGIIVPEKMNNFLVQQYGNCLCSHCLLDLSQELSTGEVHSR